MEWTLEDARLHFDQIAARAASEGPQMIRKDDATVYVVSEERAQTAKEPRLSLIDFLIRGPSLEGLDLSRDKSPMRDPKL